MTLKSRILLTKKGLLINLTMIHLQNTLSCGGSTQVQYLLNKFLRRYLYAFLYCLARKTYSSGLRAVLITVALIVQKRISSMVEMHSVSSGSKMIPSFPIVKIIRIYNRTHTHPIYTTSTTSITIIAPG